MNDVMHFAKRQKLKWFNTTPYPAQVIVYILGEDEALRRAIPDHPEHDEGVNGRCCWMKKDGYNIITIGVKRDLGDFMAVAAHECYHAMNACYNWFGAYHDNENDEPGAYFLGHLVREFTICFAELTEEKNNGENS